MIGAVGCFIAALKYYGYGMPYVAETSSNPTPSETAKVLGPQMMNSAQKWFYYGLGFIIALTATLFIKKKRI